MTLIVIENIKHIDPRTGKEYEDVRYTEVTNGDLSLDRSQPPLTRVKGERGIDGRVLLGRITIQTITGVVLDQFETETADIPVQSSIIVPEEKASNIWLLRQNKLTYVKIDNRIYLNVCGMGAVVKRFEKRSETWIPFTTTISDLFGSWFEDMDGKRRPDEDHPWIQVKQLMYVQHVPGEVIKYEDTRIYSLTGSFLELPPHLHPTVGDN